jgi:prevent-host-death family protein
MPRRDPKVVTESLPAFIVRTRFGQILERVSKRRQRFLVTKNGEATAVILGVEDFLEAVVKTPETLRTLQKQAKQSGVSKLTLEDIEAEIAAVRQEKKKRKA